ncbi:MAG: energy-coupling factor transporter ATPase [Oscillospiraceae bacterium]|nr:energy-coupling factor transporter ATPase [Oscillospiraceae bacterium]
MSQTPILKTEGLTHTYGAGTPFETVAIHDVDLSVYPGEFIGLVGHTGSGKSTLIQHLNGLVKPTGGRVLVGGEDLQSSKETLRNARFRVGLVFQYPEYQLFEETVYKDIAFGPKNMGLVGEDVDRRVHEAAGFAGVPEEMLDKSPFDLSGGEKRRVAIAGVIAMRPEVLILDEPLAGLDPKGCEDILAHIQEYHTSTGAAVIMVTHSMEAAARVSDRIVVMHKGTVAMEGTSKEVFSRGEALRAMGLEIPAVTKVLLRLRELGVDVDPAAFTVEDAAKAIVRLKGGHNLC